MAKAESLFHAALELPPTEREAFLQQTCAEDANLHREVTALLRASGIADNWLKDSDVAVVQPGIPSTIPAGISEGPGTVVGRYKLLEMIGEGGFGTVYMAEQQQPVRRKVALKIIKLGMDTKSVIARFEAERQALALMDHPHIAKVLDAGATDTGRPYFVMELVRGVPITRYCEENRLSVTERLKLVIQICGAIQHAHQKGVIHRDIKPTNVLVTLNDGTPHPMLIDFGVAKAVNQRLTEKTLFTNFAQMIGTPAYMSPEQAEMSKLDVDTRSDVYSLGVLLYELLTGTTPFPEERLRRAGYVEMQRIICEEAPARPSTRLTRRANLQANSAPAPRPSPLATDLDWIVMKCLEKDRNRRYDTANGLAMDLRRHLDNEPVAARPPGRLYEFQKSVRRHKVAFAATAAVILALGTGVLVSSWQARRAQHAESQALAAQSQAIKAQKKEAELHRQAKAQELAARRRAYASDMMVADQYLRRNNLGHVLDLLDRQRPEPGQTDLRGWEWRYLWQQSRSDAVSALGRKFGRVSSLAISPDRNWLVVGMVQRGGLSVWDLRTRRETFVLATNEERIRAVFSPTEPLLALASLHRLDSGEQRSTLRLWNAATQTIRHEPISLTGECAGLSFSQDGRTLVTSTVRSPTAGGRLTLWRVADGTQLTNYASDQSVFQDLACFAATPDLSRAAYTFYPPSEEGQWIRVVNLRDGKEVWRAPAARLRLTSLAFSPDGGTLAAGWGVGESRLIIKLWDVAEGKETEPLKGHGSHVSSMVFWPDGTKLASASVDQTIRVWDLKTRKCLDVLRGQAEPVLKVALSPDGQTLVSGGGREGTVCFWDTSVTHPREPHLRLPLNVLAWCFSPDSRSVVALHEDGKVARWSGSDFQRREPMLQIGTNLPAASYFYRFSPDGRRLAAGSFNGVLQVWDVSQGRLQRRWTNTLGRVVPIQPGFPPEGDASFTWSETDNRLHKWDLGTGRELLWWIVPPWPWAGAVSPDGHLAVVTDEMGNLWRLSPSGRRPLKLSSSLVEARDVGFSPDGVLVAVSSLNVGTWVWDTATWQVQATNLYGLFRPAFAPDGKRLATGAGTGRALSLWDTASWKNVLTLNGELDGFGDTAFSPDGDVIGSSNQEGTLHLWRAPSWEEIEGDTLGRQVSVGADSVPVR